MNQDAFACIRVPAEVDIKAPSSDTEHPSTGSETSGGSVNCMDLVYLPETKSLVEPREQLDLDLDRRAISDTACRYMGTCKETEASPQSNPRRVRDWSDDTQPGDFVLFQQPRIVHSKPFQSRELTADTDTKQNSGQSFEFEKRIQLDLRQDDSSTSRTANTQTEGQIIMTEPRSDDDKSAQKVETEINEEWEAVSFEPLPFSELFPTPMSSIFGFMNNRRPDDSPKDQLVPEWPTFSKQQSQRSLETSCTPFPAGPYVIGGPVPPLNGYSFIPPGVPSPFSLATPTDYAGMFSSPTPSSPFFDTQTKFSGLSNFDRVVNRRFNMFVPQPPQGSYSQNGATEVSSWTQLPNQLTSQQHALLAQGSHGLLTANSPRILAPMPQPSMGYVMSFPQSHPYIYVSPNGLLTVIMKYDISVEMTLDKTIRVVNHRHKAVASTNARGNSSCIYHIAAKLWQENTLVEVDLYGQRKALMTTDSCHVASGSLCYCIRGREVTPVPPNRFSDMTADRSVSLLYSSQGYGEHVVPNCEQMVQTSRFYPTVNGLTVVVNGVRICQDERGDVAVTAGRKTLKVSPVLGSAMVRTHFVYMAVEMNWTVKVRRGNHSLDGSYVGLKVSNGLMLAGFDECRVPFSEPADVEAESQHLMDCGDSNNFCEETTFWKHVETAKPEPTDGACF